MSESILSDCAVSELRTLAAAVAVLHSLDTQSLDTQYTQHTSSLFRVSDPVDTAQTVQVLPVSSVSDTVTWRTQYNLLSVPVSRSDCAIPTSDLRQQWEFYRT